MNRKRSILFLFFALFPLLILNSYTLLHAQQVDAITSSIQYLAEQLSLNPAQIEKIKSVLVISEQQMVRDRQMFGKNQDAMIEAAEKRWEMTDSHIYSSLTTQQQTKYSGVKDIIILDEDTIVLVEIIDADYKLSYKINQLVLESDKQAWEDRQKYRQSAKALISAATARQEMLDSQISATLTSDQKQSFYTYKKEREKDHMLFELKEGLILSEDQTAKVKSILDSYRDKMEEFHDKKPKSMQGGMNMNMGPGGRGGGGGGGMMSGGPPGGGGGGMMGGGPPDGGMGGRDPEKMKEMKEMQAKMSEAIRQLLDSEQLYLYQQIEEMRNERMQGQVQGDRPERPNENVDMQQY